MLTSKVVLVASLALATTGALAESGDVNVNDWSGSGSTVTRAQVKAELREATRLGLVTVGEGDIPVATAEQERLIAKAGHDAAGQFAKSAGDAQG
jgi:hypothetical protein